MKLSATFAVLAVLSVKTFVSAFAVADDFDLEMRDEFYDGEIYDMSARDLLDYINEFEEVDARDLDADEDFLYVRVPVYGMRLDPLKMAKNTGETRLQNAVQKVIDQKLRPQPPAQIRIPRPNFQQVAQQAVKQARRPNAADITRDIKTDFKNLQQKIDNANAVRRP
ncbi:hypothetical protein EST38_g5416 [Candolleomyces aberdarensis]|uniref:Uncharacterized protein n=1 Tax=Candolleomyces aberdarensis TaxID=2316362 RepID=A0A4Q2DKH9_9AGAR|nr:hypothetical protein EST38_g5416 [Candolleomyces aberdarensis]